MRGGKPQSRKEASGRGLSQCAHMINDWPLARPIQYLTKHQSRVTRIVFIKKPATDARTDSQRGNTARGSPVVQQAHFYITAPLTTENAK